MLNRILVSSAVAAFTLSAMGQQQGVNLLPNNSQAIAGQPAVVAHENVYHAVEAGSMIAMNSNNGFLPVSATESSSASTNPTLVAELSALPEDPSTIANKWWSYNHKSPMNRSHVRVGYDEELAPHNIIGSFSTILTNVAPGQCKCFGFYGGGGSYEYALNRKHDLIGRADYLVAPNATPGQDLRLLIAQAGTKYNWHPRESHYTIFAEALGGLAKPHSNFAANNDLTFAVTVGGGTDYSINKSWSWRVIEIGGTLTGEGNGGDNLQENLRLTTGIKYKFFGHSRFPRFNLE